MCIFFKWLEIKYCQSSSCKNNFCIRFFNSTIPLCSLFYSDDSVVDIISLSINVKIFRLSSDTWNVTHVFKH